MTGEKKSSDLSSRLSVKRGGKLISRTLGKSSSPPSISAPPKAAVGATKIKKDEVQRRKNSFHDMLHGSSEEKDGRRTASGPGPRPNVPEMEHAMALTVPSSDTTRTPETSSGDVVPSKPEIVLTPDVLIIQELGEALDAARDETASMRQQLERVKQDAQADVEISKFQASEMHRHGTSEGGVKWCRNTPQQSDAEMNDQDPDFQRPLNAREEDLINQNHDLRYRLTELQNELVIQMEHLPKPVHSDADWDALTLRLHETEKESHSRFQQLLSLKSSISSLTRADSQVSDSELIETFTQLANRVREWVVSNYRRTKMNLDGLPGTTVRLLQSIKVDFRSLEGADKLALYQAIVSRILMRIFAEPLVIGMPDQGVHAGLRTFAGSMQGNGLEYREWRRATLRLVANSTTETEIVRWKDDELARLANCLEGIMSSITSTALKPHARSALLSIMVLATDLQRTLSLQTADYRIVSFDALGKRENRFDNCSMESINDPEDTMEESREPYVQREFTFCVFPCLQKHDNDFVNIVFRARVCCGVG